MEKNKEKNDGLLLRQDLSEEINLDKIYGTITGRVRECIASSQGRIPLNFVYDFCDACKDPKLKSAVRQALWKAKKDGLIISDGDQAGIYRKIENNFEVVDVRNIKDTKPLDIRLPLGMDSYCPIYSKEIIADIGVVNQGKTCTAAEFARINMDRWKVFYFSSEMSAKTFGMRLSKHRETPLSEWKINFVESFSNYKDVVQPDDINIFDYVESNDGEFYKIPSILSGIHKALRNGVAFVCLQKNPGVGHGIGGFQTLAKPSLCFTLEGNVCTIIKAKNFNTVNPNGFSVKFKIHDGINLSRVGDWIAP